MHGNVIHIHPRSTMMIPSRYSILLLCFAAAFLDDVRATGTTATDDDGDNGTTTFDYRDALAKCIVYFQGQRSGKLIKSQQLNNTWRGDSALTDGQSDNVDLIGGYYRAGDNVKATLPMAFTTTMLAWGTMEYAKRQRLKSEFENTQAAIRWGADYLMKCATAKPGVFYVQVGDPNKDHICWERPEDMDTDRTAFSVTNASDVAGETAAALAAAAVVFRVVDRPYSAKLIRAARSVMQFAMDNLGDANCTLYCPNSGYKDELMWGAAWLFHATNDETYLNYIDTLDVDDDVNTFSWENKFAGARILLSRKYLLEKEEKFKPFTQQAEKFICTILPGGSETTYTPGGLIYKMDGNNLQYVTAITFLLTTYAKHMVASSKNMSFTCGGTTVTTQTLRDLAKKQVDYILGDNPMGMSYMVGFGDKYPQRVHHRAASLPSVLAQATPVSCGAGFSYLYATTPDPNLLLGAVVGGPDSNDNFAADRGNYAQSEPITYINAAFLGSLAYFASSTGKN